MGFSRGGPIIKAVFAFDKSVVSTQIEVYVEWRPSALLLWTAPLTFLSRCQVMDVFTLEVQIICTLLLGYTFSYTINENMNETIRLEDYLTRDARHQTQVAKA